MRFLKTISIILSALSVMMIIVIAFSAAAYDQDKRLIRAAENDDVVQLKSLLAAGADVHTTDGRGRTALLAATYGNHAQVAELLIAAGADVNAQDDLLNSAFLLAGAEGYDRIVTAALSTGRVNFKLTNRYGGTALIPAAEKGHLNTVLLLLKTPIDINHTNHLGWTALLEAVVLSDGGPVHQEIIQALINAGADVNIADTKGVTALQHARQRGFASIVKMLESAGGR